MAVKHNAEIHSDITGIILRLITPHSSLEPTVRALAADCPGRAEAHEAYGGAC
jgi:hypothetical protein